MSSKPSPPLNRAAASSADNALYSAHEKDPRPNALFDKQGHKKPLNSSDPAQDCLRQEWIDLYGKSGGKLEESKSKNDKAPGSPVQKCVLPKAALIVTVLYDPILFPVPNATVYIVGATTKTLPANGSGVANFGDLQPGPYAVFATYDQHNKLVDMAKSTVGSTHWAVAVSRQAPGVDEFPEGTNKCNCWVYEMLTDSGYSVPTKSHTKKWGFGSTVQLPLNAGDWASPTMDIAIATIVFPPEPGDIIAWSHPEYSDATGHVGIVSYPKPSSVENIQLSAGETGSVVLKMRRQVISAHSDSVVEDSRETFWHYFDKNDTKEIGRILFRRLK